MREWPTRCFHFSLGYDHEARALIGRSGSGIEMNLQALIVVIIRLMALDFLLQVAVHVTPQFLQLLRLYERSGPVSSRSAALPWLVLGGLIVSAVLFWVLA